MMVLRKFAEDDIIEVLDIWNSIVLDKNAFPQMDVLNIKDGLNFFLSQTYTGVCSIDNEIVGIYILHPNNIGRCAHICNASYAVKKNKRGFGIGEALVKDCIIKAIDNNFKILQFNAVVASNKVALNLYEKLGFIKLGVIKNGFLNGLGKYEDIIPHYIELKGENK